MVYRNDLIGFATMSYNQDAKQLLRSFKELGESSLAKLMAENIFPLLDCFIDAPKVLVPVPSNRNTLRERGFNPAEVIARELCRLDRSLSFQNLLTRTRTTRDQSKLNVSERSENQRDSIMAMVGHERVLLVDDIVTTGATLKASQLALETAGNIVAGFVTFAETESKKE